MPKKKPDEPEKKDWLVRVKKALIVEVIARNCTEEQAQNYPGGEHFDFDTEQEVDCYTDSVESVREHTEGSP